MNFAWAHEVITVVNYFTYWERTRKKHKHASFFILICSLYFLTHQEISRFSQVVKAPLEWVQAHLHAPHRGLANCARAKQIKKRNKKSVKNSSAVRKNVDVRQHNRREEVITECSRIWCASHEKNLLFPETLLQTYEESPSKKCVNLERKLALKIWRVLVKNPLLTLDIFSIQLHAYTHTIRIDRVKISSQK